MRFVRRYQLPVDCINDFANKAAIVIRNNNVLVFDGNMPIYNENILVKDANSLHGVATCLADKGGAWMLNKQLIEA